MGQGGNCQKYFFTGNSFPHCVENNNPSAFMSWWNISNL